MTAALILPFDVEKFPVIVAEPVVTNVVPVGHTLPGVVICE